MSVSNSTRRGAAVSRRGLIAGVATGAAVTVAGRPAVAEPTADAELIAIGRALDTLLPELERRQVQQQARLEIAHQAARSDPAWATTSPQQRHHMLGRFEDLHGVNDPDVEMETPSFALDRMARRSETITATTWAGLRTKARLVAYAHGTLGEDDSELRSLLADLAGLPADRADRIQYRPCGSGEHGCPDDKRPRARSNTRRNAECFGDIGEHI